MIEEVRSCHSWRGTSSSRGALISWEIYRSKPEPELVPTVVLERRVAVQSPATCATVVLVKSWATVFCRAIISTLLLHLALHTMIHSNPLEMWQTISVTASSSMVEEVQPFWQALDGKQCSGYVCMANMWWINWLWAPPAAPSSMS